MKEEQLDYFRRKKAEWYARNRDEQVVRMREKARGIKAELVAMKGGKCVDCGFAGDPVCFHFDHRDPWQKSARVQELTQKQNRAELLAELEKCDLVCANCHAVRTSRSVEVKRKITAGRHTARKERLEWEGVLGPYDATGVRLHEVVARCLPAFAAHLAERGVSASSAAYYAGDVNAFVRWAEYRGLRGDEPLGQAISRFIEARKAEGAAAASIKRLRSSLSGFARFADGLEKEK